jgi:hypothetical protein
MQVTDEQAALLHAFLEGNPEAASRAGSMVSGGRAGAFGSLLYAAFARAVRDRFSPSWTAADVVSLVASARTRFPQDDISISPRSAETLIREALGEETAGSFQPAVFLLILAEIVCQANMDDQALDSFILRARHDADARLSRT